MHVNDFREALLRHLCDLKYFLAEGAPSLHGRMLDASSDNVPSSARVQRVAPREREEDVMWG